MGYQNHLGVDICTIRCSSSLDSSTCSCQQSVGAVHHIPCEMTCDLLSNGLPKHISIQRFYLDDHLILVPVSPYKLLAISYFFCSYQSRHPCKRPWLNYTKTNDIITIFLKLSPLHHNKHMHLFSRY